MVDLGHAEQAQPGIDLHTAMDLETTRHFSGIHYWMDRFATQNGPKDTMNPGKTLPVVPFKEKTVHSMHDTDANKLYGGIYTSLHDAARSMCDSASGFAPAQRPQMMTAIFTSYAYNAIAQGTIPLTKEIHDGRTQYRSREPVDVKNLGKATIEIECGDPETPFALRIVPDPEDTGLVPVSIGFNDKEKKYHVDIGGHPFDSEATTIAPSADILRHLSSFFDESVKKNPAPPLKKLNEMNMPPTRPVAPAVATPKIAQDADQTEILRIRQALKALSDTELIPASEEKEVQISTYLKGFLDDYVQSHTIDLTNPDVQFVKKGATIFEYPPFDEVLTRLKNRDPHTDWQTSITELAHWYKLAKYIGAKEGQNLTTQTNVSTLVRLLEEDGYRNEEIKNFEDMPDKFDRRAQLLSGTKIRKQLGILSDRKLADGLLPMLTDLDLHAPFWESYIWDIKEARGGPVDWSGKTKEKGKLSYLRWLHGRYGSLEEEFIDVALNSGKNVGLESVSSKLETNTAEKMGIRGDKHHNRKKFYMPTLEELAKAA